MLLVVDDFDTISEDEALSEFLLYGLRNTPTRVIYTSRHRVPGMRNLEVPPFNPQELEEFVSNRSEVYGADGDLCLKRAQGIMSVTNGYPLFVDDLIHHAGLVGVDIALQDWGQRRGDAAREYALRRQVEYLGHSSGEVLIALSIANRALIPVEISNIAGLTDADVETGLRALLTWRMVNQATIDGSPSPAYRMNANTSRLVHQTYRDDNRLKTFSTSFSALSGERVPEAKKFAIGKVINRTKEVFRNDSFASAKDYLRESMTGELADSPDLYGVLGWLYSSQQPLESYYESATEAFKRSHALGSSKVDTYYHWSTMEKNVAESMIEIAQEIGLTNDSIAQQWKSCEAVAELGVRRCGISQLLCYWAGYAASREAKAREYARNFTYAQGAYARSKDWLTQVLRSYRTWVNSRLVNWLPWSVLKTSGWPCPSASLKASTQKSASRACPRPRSGGVGQPPSNHVPAVPIHDDHQVEESPGHGQVGDVGGPRLVGPGNSDLFQQVGIDPVLRRRPTSAGTAVDGPQPHDSHQPLHPLPAHPPALPRQPDLHAPRPVEGCIQVLPVHGLHQGQVLAGSFPGSKYRLERATPSRAHCRAVDNDGCSRSTIPRRWARLMDLTSPIRNPAPPSAVRFPGTAGRSARRRYWPSALARC